MRNLLWIGAMSVVLVGLGCADEAEQRRQHEADSQLFWHGPNPDKSLGLEPAATDVGVNKPATPNDTH